MAELDQLDRGLDALGVGRIVLVGHSDGGLLSLVHEGFIEAMGLPWLKATVPEVTDPKTPHDTVTYRMLQTIGELFERGKTALPPRVPTIVITAGLPWFGLADADRSKHDVPGSEPELIVTVLRRMLRQVSEGR